MNNNRSCEDERHHAPLNSILEALGEEFHELWQFTEQLQASLGPALLVVANDPERHRDVQSMDLLAQRLAALAKYMLTISRLLPEEWSVNPHSALSKVTLSDLQHRLNGASGPEESGQKSGELEMF
ncbi:hypothetical protein [Acidocella aromatica]|uniref:Uncharacterized protein n=1 Tax=Acidocella aromatica TaxID=1303579 RepID=A0A840V8R6_9PROT|nr:hypothetical protein [Acidocella aromatica]MBB5371874.1 hypothetical protein [Acidocella aromatica]